MAPGPSLLFHPFTIILIDHQIVTLTAAFTTPQSSLRPALCALLVTVSCTGLAQYSNYTNASGVLGSMITATPPCTILLFIDRLLLRRWAFEDRHRIFPAQFGEKKKTYEEDDHTHTPQQERKAPTAAEATQDTVGSRMAFGLEIAGSGRMIDTPWEAQNVAPFAPHNPDYIPSRPSIVARRTLIILASLILRAMNLKVVLSIDPSYYAPSREPFLTRLTMVTREEMAVRLTLAAAYWVDLYCMLQVMVGASSIVAAFVKPGETSKLRPWFGSLAHAYTVRGFWGKFWHQKFRNDFQGPAKFLTHNILHLKRGSLPARYSTLSFVFFISGLVHFASDLGRNMPPSHSGALRFFCTCALGIMLEDAVQAVYRRLVGHGGGLGTRIAGYVWTGTFLGWATPCWGYPQLRVWRWEERILGFYV
ncbi:membrane bound O-acyl transferase family-domain-containing protein [Usnea florida]